MSNRKSSGLLAPAILVVLILVVLTGTVYKVEETQQVVITQFGNPVGDPVLTPGLHLKVPFIQVANFFDKRFLEWTGEATQMPTRDKRFIWVDGYARWRISDPLLFFQRLRDERGGQSRLDDILDGETRTAIARYDLVEVVRSSNRDPDDIPTFADEEMETLEKITTGRLNIANEILQRASERSVGLGIELLDYRIKRLNYVEEVQKDVFARMIAERRRIAERFRSEGEGESARIQGERERDLQRIQSEAYRQAQEIRGRADATATQIYADAHGRDPAFFSFMKSLETYEETMDANSTLVLTTDSDLLRNLKNIP
ncbi:MAG TPA: protease modulator HflC [Acidobacteriota bacterium]|nr:protease modulator HflC [Acidobacteriota bacterium]